MGSWCHRTTHTCLERAALCRLRLGALGWLECAAAVSPLCQWGRKENRVCLFRTEPAPSPPTPAAVLLRARQDLQGAQRDQAQDCKKAKLSPGCSPAWSARGPYASLPLLAICGRPARPCHWRPLEPPRPSEEPSRVPPSCVTPRSEPCACREGLACLLQGEGHSLRRTQSDTSFFRIQRGQPASMSQVCRVMYLACTELGW